MRDHSANPNRRLPAQAGQRNDRLSESIRQACPSPEFDHAPTRSPGQHPEPSIGDALQSEWRGDVELIPAPTPDGTPLHWHYQLRTWLHRIVVSLGSKPVRVPVRSIDVVPRKVAHHQHHY